MEEFSLALLKRVDLLNKLLRQQSHLVASERNQLSERSLRPNFVEEKERSEKKTQGQVDAVPLTQKNLLKGGFWREISLEMSLIEGQLRRVNI